MRSAEARESQARWRESPQVSSVKYQPRPADGELDPLAVGPSSLQRVSTLVQGSGETGSPASDGAVR